ncbi:MAG: TatD family hydrolase [Candidatus Paceibacteria bacterium]
MKPKYFDIHSHINFSHFDEDRDEVIKRMHKERVWVITVGTDLKTSKEVVDLADKHENIFATIGLHPESTQGKALGTFNAEDYNGLVKNKKVVAVGECGLDYYRIRNDESGIRKQQKENFVSQIEFALENDLPLMLHFRPSGKTMDAYEDGLEILSSYHKTCGEKLRGNAHFFAGSLEIAKKFLNIGFTLSFTGVITFANAYDEIIKYAPLEGIMAETDCPFVAPVPHRGERCEPIYVKEVAKRIAQIRGENEDVMAETLVSNAFRVFTAGKGLSLPAAVPAGRQGRQVRVKKSGEVRP